MDRRDYLKITGLGLGSAAVLGWGFNRLNLFGKENYYLQGNYAPVKEIITEDNLEVIGSIPKELSGLYLRNGPNPIGSPNVKKYHWFTGEGMLHGVRIDEGKAIWYRNNLVGSGNNTHVISHAGKIYAIAEAGDKPVEIDQQLNSLDTDPFHGTLETGFTAHTKFDSQSKELHGITYAFPRGSYEAHYVVIDKDGRVKRTDLLPLSSGTMLHECAITENYVLVLDLSITFALSKLAKGYFPFSWNDDHQARIGLLNRKSDNVEIKWFNIDPCYFFHTVNAYEDQQGNVVVDAMRYQRLFDEDWNGPFTEFPSLLTRWTLNLANGNASEQQLDDLPAEFPRMHPHLNGKFNRFGYLLGTGLGVKPDFGRIIKYDFVNKSNEVYELGEGKEGAESVFIPSENQKNEDDGYLMTYVYDKASDKSNLVIFHAQNIKSGPIAQIKLPQRVPFGFHGSWVPA
ncbi:TPA: carotenoid oxygenase [Candidatus Poribacteria bacterium]|jgi:carotenoid cleavage dioxygenase|nr:carotenoid oxygenase [Candidatus Poribacteria bacterium]|tara:strand:+ start:8894 stop:10261 length:1368 start_codon:yes stop_codon:yes gene_type:complete